MIFERVGAANGRSEILPSGTPLSEFTISLGTGLVYGQGDGCLISGIEAVGVQAMQK